MLVVALTGGIGAGKSTVAEMLARLGAVVVDADAVARELVEPGTPALAEIVERFGSSVLTPDGALDRPALAAVVFADERARRDLEAILHPRIARESRRRRDAAPADAVVVHDVPLLAESPGLAAEHDVVVVVEAPLDQRLVRLAARGMAEDEARSRIAAQAGDEERRRLADHVIDNSGDLHALERDVDTLWRELRAAAAN